MNLELLGWNPFFEGHFQPYQQQGLSVGRVASEQKNFYRLYTSEGEILAQVSGKMHFEAQQREDYPAVGDWVVVSVHAAEKRGTIHAVLPRQSKFSRKVAGESIQEQIVAANVDTVFLVNALNLDFNLRRIERYLTLAWESGARPIIILSKADLCEDVEQKLTEVKAIALGVPIYVISSLRGQGLDLLLPYVQKGNTVALLGSSGAGKSTLINYFLGENVQSVKEVREGDDRGKHTTTSRELFVLPHGGLMMDTPGMRELQLWGTDEGLSESFEDIEGYAARCRFSDCQHEAEPGCAVKRAIQEGELTSERYESYLKLKKELAYLFRKENQQAYLAEKEKWKKLHQALKSQKHR